MSLRVKTADGKTGWIMEGETFEATDKLGKSYLYEYRGIEQRENGYNIHLHNISDGTETYVEPAWFTEREIKKRKIKEEDGERVDGQWEKGGNQA